MASMVYIFQKVFSLPKFIGGITVYGNYSLTKCVSGFLKKLFLPLLGIRCCRAFRRWEWGPRLVGAKLLTAGACRWGEPGHGFWSTGSVRLWRLGLTALEVCGIFLDQGLNWSLPYIGRWIFHHWATREASEMYFLSNKWLKGEITWSIGWVMDVLLAGVETALNSVYISSRALNQVHCQWAIAFFFFFTF